MQRVYHLTIICFFFIAGFFLPSHKCASSWWSHQFFFMLWGGLFILLSCSFFFYCIQQGVLIDTFHLHRSFQMLESCFCHLNTVKDFSSFTMVTLSHLSQMFQNQMWIRVCHQMKSVIITPRGKDTKDDRHDIKKNNNSGWVV